MQLDLSGIGNKVRETQAHHVGLLALWGLGWDCGEGSCVV